MILICTDDGTYLAKGIENGISNAKERMVARMAAALSAPVPAVRLIDISAEFIALSESELEGVRPGTAHGSTWVEAECFDSDEIIHFNGPNRPRFASLAILYGWAWAGDRQFLYETEPPHLVHSADHGMFFPYPDGYLDRGMSTAVPDRIIVDAASLTRDELQAAARALVDVSDADVVEIVRSVPLEWEVDEDLLSRYANYIARRRDELLNHLRA